MKLCSLTYLNNALRLTLVVLFLSMATHSHAQNNPYKISDKLYPLYVKAYNNRRSIQGLMLADSLRQRAITMGDHKAEVLALLIDVQYNSFIFNNFAALNKSCDKVRAKAMKYNLMQYYFYCTVTMATYLSVQGKEQEALELLKKDTEYAKKTNNLYGIQTGYVTMGNILLEKKQYGHAIRYYQHAFQFVKTHMEERARSAIYPKLAMTYLYMGKFHHVIGYVNEGFPYCYTDANRATLLAYKCIAQYMLADYQGYRNTYNEFLKYKNIADNLSSSIRHLFNIIQEIEQNKTDFSDSQNKISTTPQIWEYAKYAYYYKHKQYQKASEALHEVGKILMGNNTDDIMQDFTELTATYNDQIIKIDRQKVENEQAKLQLEHAKLQLLNTNQELSIADNAKRLQQMMADQNALAFHNQQLKANQLRDSLNSQSAIISKEKQRQQTSQRILIFVSAFIVVLIFLIYIYLWQHRKMQQRLLRFSRKLENTLEELNVASAQAQKSDLAKTKFIQDMSHEIRTPLNAIVGFSQVLSEMGDMLGNEEKADITNRITENSEMLSTLINDILDLTSIESGKYVMKIEEAPINHLCREAMESMRHRVAEGVELHYQTDASNEATLNTDILRTQQVLTHLLVNAAKNTTEGSITLDCSTTKNPGMVTFTITDTGIGVPPEKIQQIFERFKKVDYFKQGSGLGLEISRTIAHRLGGMVNIDPYYTTGARFWFTVSNTLAITPP